MGTTRNLKNQVALVTGGGRGLGRALAHALAEEGAAVSILARTRSQVEETVKSIEKLGGRVVSLVGDVSNTDDIERIVSLTEEQLGPVDLLINNAAVGGEVKSDWETDPEQWWRTMEINLRGPYLCIRRILPGMVERGKGKVINISTGAVQGQFPYLGPYTISKTALTQYSNILASQLQGTGISVFAYDPGFLRTYLTEVYGQRPEIHSSLRDMFKAGLEQGLDTPMETTVRKIISLASGQADALTDRFISVGDNETELLSRTEEILDKDLYTLRINQS